MCRGERGPGLLAGGRGIQFWVGALRVHDRDRAHRPGAPGRGRHGPATKRRARATRQRLPRRAVATPDGVLGPRPEEETFLRRHFAATVCASRQTALSLPGTTDQANTDDDDDEEDTERSTSSACLDDEEGLHHPLDPRPGLYRRRRPVVLFLSSPFVYHNVNTFFTRLLVSSSSRCCTGDPFFLLGRPLVDLLSPPCLLGHHHRSLDVLSTWRQRSPCVVERGRDGRTGRSVVVAQGSAATFAALQATGIGVVTTVAVVRSRRR